MMEWTRRRVNDGIWEGDEGKGGNEDGEREKWREGGEGGEREDGRM